MSSARLLAQRTIACVALVLVLVPLVSCATSSAGSSAGSSVGARNRAPVLIANVTILDTAGAAPRVMRAMDVLARDGRFVAIGTHGTLAVPADTILVDGTDRYLIPGLADAHVHFDFDETSRRRDTQFVREPNEILCRLFVAHGVTFVRSMWGTASIVRLRDELNARKRIGPSMITTGPLLSGMTSPPIRTLKTTRDVEDILAEHEAAGFDALKIHSNPSAEACRALLDLAHERRIPVHGHVPRSLPLTEFLAHPAVTSIEHVTQFVGACVSDESTSLQAGWPAMMAMYNEQDEAKQRREARRARQSGKWFCPTLLTSATEGMSPQEFETYLDTFADAPVTAATVNNWRRMVGQEKAVYAQSGIDLSGLYDAPRAIVRAFIAASVPLIAGTDSPVRPGVAGHTLHAELAEFVALGMTPYEAIRTATVNVAAAVGQSDTFGRIAVGLRADAVLLHADPLESIANLARIDAVLLGGRLLDRAALDGLLDESRALAADASAP